MRAIAFKTQLDLSVLDNIFSTVIDNIFSNNTVHESVSGNIMTHISDHFPQFIILNKINIDYKSCSYAKRNFSNFDEQNFIDGFKKQDMSFLENTNLSMNSKFDLFYEKCLLVLTFMLLSKK